ncbi:GPP34 family phosphoprotein [Streptomyces sp. NPDC088197]|uniref:GPP34 family phosphoprotein n=1 Tax=unclassified Streptomyces TaxID=2593676 RepID=UPI0033B5E823
MTTPRDLIVVAMDVPPDLLVDRGDLSLALAGAELIDLIAAKELTLRGDRVVPVPRPEGERRTADRLLGEALTAYETATRSAEAADRDPGRATDKATERAAGEAADRPTGKRAEPAAESGADDNPGERVEDWLWRRGRDLPTAYIAALEEDGTLVPERHRRWGLLPTSRRVLADTPGRRRAAQHWASDAPVLRALATLIGVKGDEPPPDEVPTGSPSRVVLRALRHAVEELAEERRLRTTRLDRANATYRSRGY